MLHKIFLAASLFFAGVAFGAQNLNKPNVALSLDPHSPTEFSRKFELHHFSPKNRCAGILRSGMPVLARQAVKTTSKAFESRREYSKEFILSRLNIAEKYWGRTRQQVVTDKTTKKVAGSIALTIAEYHRDYLPDPKLSFSENEKRGHQMLPEEETLGIVLPRPTLSNGRGIIMELRVYYMDHESHLVVRPQLLEATRAMSFEAMKWYEELYFEPVIHSFNDLDGVKVYTRHFGYEVIESELYAQPIEAYKNKWWLMHLKPSELERRLLHIEARSSEAFVIENANMPVVVDVSSKLKVEIKPGTYNAFDRKKGKARFVVNIETDLGDGLIAAAGSAGELSGGRPIYVGDIRKAIQIGNLKIERGSYYVELNGHRFAKRLFHFDSPPADRISEFAYPRIRKSRQLVAETSEDSKIYLEAIVIPKGSWVEMTEFNVGTNSIEVIYPARDMEFAPGLWAKSRSRIEVSDRTVTIYRLAKPFKTGTQGDFAVDTSLKFDLAEEGQVSVIESGIWMPGGTNEVLRLPNIIGVLAPPIP